jgi:hypothetical protein
MTSLIFWMAATESFLAERDGSLSWLPVFNGCPGASELKARISCAAASSP